MSFEMSEWREGTKCPSNHVRHKNIRLAKQIFNHPGNLGNKPLSLHSVTFQKIHIT